MRLAVSASRSTSSSGTSSGTRLPTLLLISLLLLLLSSFFLSTVNAQDTTTTLSSSTSSSSSSSSSSTTSSSTETETTDENLQILGFLIVVSGAVLVVFLLVKSEFHYLPESVAVVIYGIIVGIILRFIKSEIADHLATFDPELFFLFLLPSIIFESGFSLQKTPFFSNIGSILAFAIFGTLVSFAVVGGLLYLLGQGGVSYPLSFQEAMTTGALLSATDPVATLAIFQALNVDQQLYMVIFGESILNDAVALILYRASVNFSGVWASISIFFVVAFGSLLLGIAIAVALSALLRVLHIRRFPPLETIFMIIFSYMSYVAADALNLSGIMSVFWCGIAFNHYGAYSLSPYTTLTSRQLFRTLAFVCETSVFIYIGISIATVPLNFDWGLIAWIIILSLFARAIHVFPICFILNKFKKKKFTPQIQIAIWFAGLRGAIAFSLSLDLTGDSAKYIKTATLIFVHFTLFGMGIGTLPLLKYLKIKSASTDQSLDNISKPREKTKESTSTKSKGPNFLARIDENYFKVWFRRPAPPLAREAVDLFEKLVSTSNESELKQHATKTVISPETSRKQQYNGAQDIVSDEHSHNIPEQHHTFDHIPLEIHSDDELEEEDHPLVTSFNSTHTT